MKRALIIAAVACLLGGALLWLHRRDMAREAAFEAGFDEAAGEDMSAP